MLIVTETGVPTRRRRRRISSQPDVPDAGSTRVTVIDTAAQDGDDADARRAKALAVVTRAMTTQAVASANASLHTAPPPPLAVRIGSGSGEQVADGRWEDAFELPPTPIPPRRRAPVPSEGRFAELLGGRASFPSCALLALRARSDFDSGRTREGVLMTDAAVACAVAELDGLLASERLAAIAGHSAAASAAAAEARNGVPGPKAQAESSAALERLEAALRSLL